MILQSVAFLFHNAEPFAIATCTAVIYNRTSVRFPGVQYTVGSHGQCAVCGRQLPLDSKRLLDRKLRFRKLCTLNRRHGGNRQLGARALHGELPVQYKSDVFVIQRNKFTFFFKVQIEIGSRNTLLFQSDTIQHQIYARCIRIFRHYILRSVNGLFPFLAVEYNNRLIVVQCIFRFDFITRRIKTETSFGAGIYLYGKILEGIVPVIFSSTNICATGFSLPSKQLVFGIVV
ncbi:hypothetical protein ABXS75_03705 [Roseburia hominis]